ALLEQARRDDTLLQVEDELFEVMRLIDGNAEMTIALDSTREAPAQRGEIISRLLEGRTDRLTVALAARAVSRSTGLKPARRISEFARFASERRRQTFALVSSAVPLSEAQVSRLESTLVRIYGQQIHLNVQVDPDVVGGLRIQVGDDLFD